MRKRGFSRLAIISAVAVALAAQTPAPVQGRGQKGAPPEHAGTRSSISPVYVFSPTGDGPIIYGAGSQLVRAKDGVFMTFHTQGLAPGSVATAWWVFFNNPKACFTSPCRVADLLSNPDSQPSLLYGAGRVVGPDGALDIGAFVAAGDTTGAVSVPVPPFPANNPGLLDPKRAEVHIVIRTHGLALAGAALTQQLTTFNGGCPTNTCVNLQVAIHEP